MLGRLTCFVKRHHDYRLRGSTTRVFLECGRCGHRSPGWEMGPRTVRPLVTPRVSKPPLRLLLDEPFASMPVPHNGSSLRAPLQTDELRLWLDASPTRS